MDLVAKKVLLLASQSSGRARLLKESGINFKVVEQSADEYACDWSGPLAKVLNSIALHKMQHVQLKAGTQKGEHCFIVTADTMGQGSDGIIQGKPQDKNDAIEQIKSLNGMGLCGTAFCLDKKEWDGGQWILNERIIDCVITEYEFYVPEPEIERYLAVVDNYMSLSGSITIDGYGGQYLKWIKGSYSTILGLPLFELRQALIKIGFLL